MKYISLFHFVFDSLIPHLIADVLDILNTFKNFSSLFDGVRSINLQRTMQGLFFHLQAGGSLNHSSPDKVIV